MNDHSFLQDFHHVATIGATFNNGVDRQAATANDAATRTWFAQWIQDAGFELRVDGIGNMFGLTEWTPGAPYVLIGSHLDSQPLAGRFDGAYGVVAAMHAAQEISRRIKGTEQAPKFNLAVVNWFNEEGSRFAPSLMGSSVFAGLFDQDETLAIVDPDNISVQQALSEIGFLGTDPRPIPAAYAEIHIEQGRILEREGVDIGLVEHSWYTQKLDIEVLGEQSHTGATAMADRHDALVAASKIVLMVHDVTKDYDEEALVSSIGRLSVEPNSPIVVARRVHLVADLRSGDPAIVRSAREKLLRDIEALAREHDIQIRVNDFDVRQIRHYPESGLELSAKTAANLGFSTRRLATMAGHDSVAMNSMVPTVMLFIPSVDGVSHCERELSTDEDMVKGLHMLTEVAQQLVHGKLTEGNDQASFPSPERAAVGPSPS
ncbi:M20 family metallo-hydrolase [Arthrobacter sp.]|uniref:M20 family metallo-hydrolase n=1 Tax=Arthrobacter sp. TaxID=1667 RepID=UPI0028114276|nr:M20 family metallo-hydrolase [Arthrobacter sp.]